jgi:hypothetical protein
MPALQVLFGLIFWLSCVAYVVGVAAVALRGGVA